MVVNGETVYPYEAGKLDYYRTSELSIPTGTVVSTNLIDYLSVMVMFVLIGYLISMLLKRLPTFYLH